MVSTGKRKKPEPIGGQTTTPDEAITELASQLFEKSWKGALQPVFRTASFRALATFLHEERSSRHHIFPKAEHTWAALNICPISRVRVVILGQDPYHQPDTACGLAFSVQRPVAEEQDKVTLPASLKNIYKELEMDPKIENFARPNHGCLDQWAEQGVLLLNTVLTVRSNAPNSHRKKGWENVTDAILEALRHKPCVIMLWGKPAADKVKNLTSSNHIIISCSHPSPLSALRTDKPFIGSRCFSLCNEALEKLGVEPINWKLPLSPMPKASS